MPLHAVIGWELIGLLEMGHQAFVKRFERGWSEGDLPRDKSRRLHALPERGRAGISIQAAAGVSETELRGVAEMALELFSESAGDVWKGTAQEDGDFVVILTQ